jgi:glycosyltransferase involved in cell wall biosynthesis
MLTVVVNATPLVMGGALQACASFIIQAVNNNVGIKWHFLVSTQVMNELLDFDICVNHENFQQFDCSPANDTSSRRKLLAAVNTIKPDVVFTFFGPAYVDFTCPHLMGVADGWITHSSFLAIKNKGGLLAVSKLILLFFYKRYWYKKADHWVVEADCAKKGVMNRFGICEKDIDVVSNSCGDHYKCYSGASSKSEVVKLLTLSSYYRHKNLELIPDVAYELKKHISNFEFIITIQKGTADERRIIDKASRLGVQDHIINVGPVSVKDGPKLYSDSHLVFMPSLLETFSAIYPEAMAMKRPIVTTNLKFATDICHDSALYFEPLDPHDAALKIYNLVSDPDLYSDLVSRGVERLASFPDQNSKFSAYVNVIKKLCKN